jgi:hypothetical protein
MANDKTPAEKLEGLAKRLQSGASVLHPVTEKELEAVREAVKDQEKEKAAKKEREQERDRSR